MLPPLDDFPARGSQVLRVGPEAPGNLVIALDAAAVAQNIGPTGTLLLGRAQVAFLCGRDRRRKDRRQERE
jgi:hypothetical protein